MQPLKPAVSPAGCFRGSIQTTSPSWRNTDVWPHPNLEGPSALAGAAHTGGIDQPVTTNADGKQLFGTALMTRCLSAGLLQPVTALTAPTPPQLKRTQRHHHGSPSQSGRASSGTPPPAPATQLSPSRKRRISHDASAGSKGLGYLHKIVLDARGPGQHACTFTWLTLHTTLPRNHSKLLRVCEANSEMHPACLLHHQVMTYTQTNIHNSNDPQQQQQLLRHHTRRISANISHAHSGTPPPAHTHTHLQPPHNSANVCSHTHKHPSACPPSNCLPATACLAIATAASGRSLLPAPPTRPSAPHTAHQCWAPPRGHHIRPSGPHS